MTSEPGDSSASLSDALEEILSGHRRENGEADDAAAVDDRGGIPGEPYVLPEIVPATADVPVVEEAPRLPDRSDNLHPATAQYPPIDTPTAVAAPTTEVAPPVAAPAAHTDASAPAVAPKTAWGDHMPAAAAAATAATPPATGWGDHMAPARAQQLRAPGRRPRVRRVTRVLRHIDPWSTFKIAILFNAVAYVVCLTSGVLLWRVADSTGTLDNVERWFTQFGWETFELKGDEIFHNAWIIGLFGVVAATGAAVLLVTLFNLVSDIVGGIRLTVLEEEVVERTISSTRRYVVRRPSDVAGGAGAAASVWSTDDLDATAEQPVPQTVAAPEETRSPGAETHEPAEKQTQPSMTPAASDWSVD